MGSNGTSPNGVWCSSASSHTELIHLVPISEILYTRLYRSGEASSVLSKTKCNRTKSHNQNDTNTSSVRSDTGGRHGRS